MTGNTDWLSALGILLAGLVLGFMFVYGYVMRRRDGVAPATGDLELRDLEAKRDALLQQLREGEDDAEERARLEVEAAQVLRAIDVRTQRVAAGASPAPVVGGGVRRLTKTSSSSMRPEVKGFLWGAGSTAALGLLLFFGYSKMQPKEAPVQGGPMQQPAQAQAPQADASLADLEARVKSNPDDLALRMELTHAYLDKENLMGVFDQTEYILKKNPNDAQAQTYQALVRMAMGQRDSALKLLKSATKNDPSLLDAWVALAWYYTQTGNKSEARAAIDQAIERHPEQKERLDEVWQQMQSPNPGAARAAGPPETANTAPQASGEGITITLNLASGNATGNGVLFVIARPEGVTSGPPVAVKRIAAATFPMTIDLSAADSMMGQAIPPKVRIEVRLDADGNAMTRDPSDPQAVQDGVAVGSRVSLTLK
ncbi:MAG: tetratricopeptide repeat protein [Thermoanaerobaculia bacterium]